MSDPPLFPVWLTEEEINYMLPVAYTRLAAKLRAALAARPATDDPDIDTIVSVVTETLLMDEADEWEQKAEQIARGWLAEHGEAAVGTMYGRRERWRLWWVPEPGKGEE